MNVLDLFSGIGGFSLGLERAGMRTVAFCEREPYCEAVLRKHWPDVPIYDDVCSLTGDRLRADGISADLICGGFPCQDISFAGKGAGLAGERSGLWREYARIIGEVKPRYVIVENVAALLGRGIGDVLGDLAALGYDAEWHCIPAAAVGAPHRRDRVWIVADAKSERSSKEGKFRFNQPEEWTACCGKEFSDTDKPRPERWIGKELRECAYKRFTGASDSPLPDANSEPAFRATVARRECDQWLTEPDVGRVANGVPNRVDRLKALGNAVVPKIPEIIGRAILAREGALK